MKKLFLVFLLLSMSKPGHSQQVVWEKQWGWFATDELYNLLGDQQRDTLYFAHGYTFMNYIWLKPGNPRAGWATYAVNESGDTLRRALFSPDIYSYIKLEGQNKKGELLYYARKQHNLPSTKIYLGFVKLNRNLDSVWSRTYTNQWADDWLQSVSTVKLLEDGGWLLVGSRGTGCGTDAYVVRFDSVGNIKYDRTFAYGGTGEDVDELSLCDDGNWLISGHICASNKGFALKFDPANGNIRWKRDFVINSSTQYALVKVKQNANRSFTLGGLETSSSAVFNAFAARFPDSTFSQYNWYWAPPSNGGGVAYPLEDGGVLLLLSSDSGSRYRQGNIRRIDINHNQIWNITLIPPIDVSYVIPYDIAFDKKNQAIIAGFAKMGNPFNHAEQFYLAKINNTGNPYKPGQVYPVPVKNTIVSVPPQLWPNPTVGALNLLFMGQHGAAQWQLFDPQGRLVQSSPFDMPQYQPDLRPLADGVYYYRVTSAAGVWAGKVVRE